MNDMRQMTGRGRRIERGSFEVIDREIGAHDFSSEQWTVVRRVIHATADFEFARLMAFHPEAITAGGAALRRGCHLVVDVRMIEVGLSAPRLAAYGCRVHCHISDDDVIATAVARDSTRAIEAMRKAHRAGVLDGSIVAIGNAPTALIELVRLCTEEGARPALVVGVPVGFISAAESKELVLQARPCPYIVSRGRKGGSPIAVAILHALLSASQEEHRG